MKNRNKKVISEKKLLANRENAQKSTGPKTLSGKAKSKNNAVKHGAYATSPLFWGEDRKLYQAVRDEQTQLYEPRTFVEKALVSELVSALWTLRRIAKAENLQIIDVQRKIAEAGRQTLTPSETWLFQNVEKDPAKLGTAVKDGNLHPPLFISDWDRPGEIAKPKSPLYELAKKVLGADKTYEYLYLHSANEGTFERLGTLKRQTLSIILNLERELEKRKGLRKKSPD